MQRKSSHIYMKKETSFQMYRALEKTPYIKRKHAEHIIFRYQEFKTFSHKIKFTIKIIPKNYMLSKKYFAVQIICLGWLKNGLKI